MASSLAASMASSLAPISAVAVTTTAAVSVAQHVTIPLVAATAASTVLSSATASGFSLTSAVFQQSKAQSSSAPTALPFVTTLRGGAARKAAKAATASYENKKRWGMTPQARSVAWMALGMACHYLGYSLARPITVALFTSSQTGYPNFPGSFPFAMAFVSPLSLLLLLAYGNILEQHGPRGALSRSTLGCAFTLMLTAAGIHLSEQSGLEICGIPATKFFSGPLLVFRESYVQLLTSQYWSFMASVLTPDQSARWFAPIAGLTSISSVMGGTAVKYLTDKLHLSGTLACTGLALIVSLVATGAAYSIAERHGFSPGQQAQHKVNRVVKGVVVNATTKNQLQSKNDNNNNTGTKTNATVEMIGKARQLFARVPVLKALFLEILASQGLATLLNMCFVASVGASIPNDKERAGWVGNFYAIVNVGSMILQFAVLPLLMRVIEPKVLWRLTPLISLGFTTFQAFQKHPTLYVISASLLVMKVLEYSARRMLDEMVYVPLDYESRFVGKEIIGVFGYRFGKSLISLSMSVLTSMFGQFNLQSLSILSDVTAAAWVKTAWDLSSLVPTQREAQASYDKETKEAKKGRR